MPPTANHPDGFGALTLATGLSVTAEGSRREFGLRLSPEDQRALIAFLRIRELKDETTLVGELLTMSKPRNQKRTRCGRCKAVEKIAVRRTQFYKGVLIENLPATYCLNCGEELYSLQTAELMEKIAAQPQQYAKMVELPVARVA